jgi:hypothetical protein
MPPGIPTSLAGEEVLVLSSRLFAQIEMKSW